LFYEQSLCTIQPEIFAQDTVGANQSRRFLQILTQAPEAQEIGLIDENVLHFIADPDLTPPVRFYFCNFSKTINMTYPVAKKSSSRDYTKALMIRAPRKNVYFLLTTLRGLESWWGNPVSGSPTVDGTIRFTLADPEQYSLMLVDQLLAYTTVRWTVVQDTGFKGEWLGTCIVFNLTALDPSNCELHFQHIGLTPDLTSYEDCKKGWNHFINNIVQRSESTVPPGLA
jgi:uncharacterized protein YndB with AHSA1/START domain